MLPITDQDLVLYAARHYDNPSCHGVEEFYSDLSIPTHLKKLFGRYVQNGDLKENLVINHIILFYNVFDPRAGTRILFFKIDKSYHSILKTFLVFLNRVEENTVFSEDLDFRKIPTDYKLLTYLRKTV